MLLNALSKNWHAWGIQRRFSKNFFSDFHIIFIQELLKLSMATNTAASVKIAKKRWKWKDFYTRTRKPPYFKYFLCLTESKNVNRKNSENLNRKYLQWKVQCKRRKLPVLACTCSCRVAVLGGMIACAGREGTRRSMREGACWELSGFDG